MHMKMEMPDLHWFPLKFCLINYELYIKFFVSLNLSFSFEVSLQIGLAHFLFIKSNGKIHINKLFSSHKTDSFFHIFDKIKVSRVPL